MTSVKDVEPLKDYEKLIEQQGLMDIYDCEFGPRTELEENGHRPIEPRFTQLVEILCNAELFDDIVTLIEDYNDMTTRAITKQWIDYVLGCLPSDSQSLVKRLDAVTASLSSV